MKLIILTAVLLGVAVFVTGAAISRIIHEEKTNIVIGIVTFASVLWATFFFMTQFLNYA